MQVQQNTIIIQNEQNVQSRYGKASQKLRDLIAKKFLSISLDQLRNSDFSKINSMESINLTKFINVMQILYPEDSCRNLGRKYLLCGYNQYKNDYIRDVVSEKFYLNDYLRVFWSEGDTKFDDKKEKIVIEKDAHIDKRDHDWNKVFQENIEKNLFYYVLKNQKLYSFEEDDKLKISIFDYFDINGRNLSVKPTSPNLLSFHDNNLFIFEKNVTQYESEGLKQFLLQNKNNPDKQIRQIVIESSQMSDQILSNILKGVKHQLIYVSEINKYGEDVSYVRQFLYSFVYSSNYFGKKSLKLLLDLGQDLLELKLNNIYKHQQFDFDFKQQIIHQFTHNSPYLMKLAFSNINLNNQKCVDKLCELLKNKKHLQYLDLSWTSLTPSHLDLISKELSNLSKTIRDFNISYNLLAFNDEKSPEYESSINFVKNIGSLLKKSLILNHINLSGMNFDKQNILEICQLILEGKLLMGIHLNDNGITFDQDFMLDILDKFGIGVQDIPEKRRNNDDNLNSKLQDLQSTFIHNFDIKKMLRKYMRYEPPYKKNSNENIKSESQLLNEYKDFLLFTKEYKNQETQKLINKSKHFSGIGRQDESLTDQFTLTRVLNHPELLFNQKPQLDSVKNHRFFQTDSQQKWKLSQSSECFICLKYMYLQIHYERGIIAQNKDLIEITDPQILEYLKYEYKKDYLIYRNTTPLICGTIVNKKMSQHIFERKLKMLRTSLYCLLSVVQCKAFSENYEQIGHIKDGILKYLRTDAYELLKNSKVHQQLNGWKHVLNDVSLNNEVNDIKVINMPDISAYNIEQQEWFTFADYLPSGYHQFLIYDPLLERAFCKDFVLKLNQRDFVYPEYPIHHDVGPTKIIPNMWIKWVEDSKDALMKSFQTEVNSEKFRIDRFIKDIEDEKNCLNFIRENLQQVINYQKTLLIGSSKFPQIGFDQIIQNMEKLQSDPQYPEQFINGKIKRAQIEICFIGSTLSDGQAGLKGALQRAELLDFLMRLAQQFVKQLHQSKEPIYKHLQSFFDTYITPLVKGSQIIEHRLLIRKSIRLNELLYDNNKGLIQVFEQYKKIDSNGKNGFTLKCATDFLNQFILQNFISLSRKQIEQIFLFSQMSVLNEYNNSKKYDYLVFVEFQEMICRASIVGFTDEQDTIEFKVYRFLDYIWESQYEKEIWTTESMPLIRVNQSVFI